MLIQRPQLEAPMSPRAHLIKKVFVVYVVIFNGYAHARDTAQ